MANAAFTTLLNNVYSITNRSDLVADTTYAVRAATLKLHNLDYFVRDLKESKVNFSVADYYQSITYRTLFPRFRALHYVRKFESGAPTHFLTPLSPDNVLDSYGVSKENVCYIAGDVIQLRSNTQITDVLIGYFQTPITDPDTYDSWIAEVYGAAIEAEAASTVFKMIGYDEQESRYRTLAAEWARAVQTQNILAEV